MTDTNPPKLFVKVLFAQLDRLWKKAQPASHSIKSL